MLCRQMRLLWKASDSGSDARRSERSFGLSGTAVSTRRDRKHCASGCSSVLRTPSRRPFPLAVGHGVKGGHDLLCLRRYPQHATPPIGGCCSCCGGCCGPRCGAVAGLLRLLRAPCCGAVAGTGHHGTLRLVTTSPSMPIQPATFRLDRCARNAFSSRSRSRQVAPSGRACARPRRTHSAYQAARVVRP